jgi:hypothetical protein
LAAEVEAPAAALAAADEVEGMGKGICQFFLIVKNFWDWEK